MSQPQWRFVGNLGDATPLDHGGYFIYEDTTGVYESEAELLEEPENESLDNEEDEYENGYYTIYRFDLDRCTYENGILSDNSFHPEYPAWFAHPENPDRPQDTTYLGDLASFSGQTEEELIEMFCSPDAAIRAVAYKLVGQLHGFENLDQDPLKLKRWEVERRYTQGEVE